MTSRPALMFLALSGLLQLNLVVAQGPAPQIGELIPDLEIIDDQGNPVRLRELTPRSLHGNDPRLPHVTSLSR